MLWCGNKLVEVEIEKATGQKTTGISDPSIKLACQAGGRVGHKNMLNQAGHTQASYVKEAMTNGISKYQA